MHIELPGQGSEVLLAQTVSATPRTFADDGSATRYRRAVSPWLDQQMGRASRTRFQAGRAGVAWARDPMTPNVFYVYALLGRSSSTVANASYEYLTVTTASNGRETAGAT
jgi:hypothetical protein